jgi:gamma-glutamyl:cysteine ligase YbdK (ATP-grasp superfamily)
MLDAFYHHRLSVFSASTHPFTDVRNSANLGSKRVHPLVEVTDLYQGHGYDSD